jgi:hypothetical protein
MSALSYLSPKSRPVKAVLDGSSSCSWIALMPTLLGLGLTLDWLGRWLKSSISELVSFCALRVLLQTDLARVMSWRTRSLPGRCRTTSSGRHGV